MSATTITRPLTVTPYLDRTPGVRNEDWEFATVEELWDAVVNWRENGVYVRLGFYATVQLIDAGAVERTWDELRAEAVAELDERHAGTGCGISSSDVNHTVVGNVHFSQVVDRELASC